MITLALKLLWTNPVDLNDPYGERVSTHSLPIGMLLGSTAILKQAEIATTQAGIATAKAVLTAADRVQTGLDRTQTGTDAATATTQAGIATAQAVLTAADRVQTGLDVIATGEDRVQTGLDVIATSADAEASEVAKIAAEAARDIAQLSSGIYETTAAGIAAVVSGSYFSVPQASPSDIMFDLYKNNAGVAQYINSYSSSNLIKYTAHAQHEYNFVDADGFILAYIGNGTFKTVTNTVSTGLLDAGTFIMQYLTDSVSQALTLKDPDGFIFATLSAIGKLKSTAFELDSGLLDTTLWSIGYNTVRDGYLLTDQDGFILMSLDATDGIQAVGLTSSGTSASHAKKIATLGDSRSDQISVETSNAVVRLKRISDYGYFTWANFFCSGNLEYVCNAGIGGNTTSQMLSRFNSDVLPYEPDELWGEGGINDYAVTEADTISNLTGIFDLCDANGIYVRWCTISPLETGHATFNAANIARICNINKWLREQALTRKNFTLVDSFSAMIDPASTTGSAKNGMMQTDDHIHQAPLGALAQGYAYAQSFIKDHQIIDYLPKFAGERYSLSSAFKQLFNNPLFTDTGGTNSTSGVVTGTIPANCTISKTGTWGAGLITSALVARADGFGYDWVLTVTNAGAENDELSIVMDDISAYVTNGDVLYAAAEVSMSGLLKNRGFQLEIRSSVNSVFSIVSTLEYAATQPVATDAWTDAMYNQDNVTGVMKTPKLTLGDTGSVTSCYARLKFRFGGVGSTATIKIGRMAICKN